MAQQVLVQWVDDIDGGEAVETIPFSLDGISYEIDLSDENAEHLRNELASYIAAARRTGGRRIRRTAVQATSAKSGRPREIREWAQQNGFEVSARGRLSAEIEEAYEKAHTEAEPVTTGRKRASRRKAK